MTKKTLISLGFLLSLFSSAFTQTYEYEVDLVDVIKDRVRVELRCPKIEKDEILFHFAKMAPGHTKDYTNFGLYVEDFLAFDSERKPLVTERVTVNTFKIHGAQNLNRISYLVNDTWDINNEENGLTNCVGTNFDVGKNFILNNGGLFGFFEGMEEVRFEIQFKKPENFFGLTSLKTTSKSPNIQSFIAEDFDELFDSPIMFSEPDESTFTVANTEFTIGVYNELGRPLSEHMAEIIKPKMAAVQKFVGGYFPVENYVFLFYIKDFSRLENFLIECPDFEWRNTKKALKINEEYTYSFGALEHHNSSLFCTSGVSVDQTSFELIDFVIHEFFHIYTPINLHSKLIHDFDYVNPKLSAHRWLYEGVTEYFSGLIKMKSGLYDLNFFLQEFIRPKIQMNNRFEKSFSFTEFSRNANKEPYRNMYSLSYSKGALLAMFLDFEIMRLTSCQKTLQDVFFKIYEENKNTPLEEEEIIPLFVNEVHPDLQLFFDRYIVGSDSLDFEAGFQTVGIQYQKEVQQKVPSLSLSYVPLFQYFCFKKITYPQELKSKDKVHTKNWGRRGHKPFLKPDGQFVREGEIVQLPILRNGKEQIVSFPAKYKTGVYQDKISVMLEMTSTQKKAFQKWTDRLMALSK